MSLHLLLSYKHEIICQQQQRVNEEIDSVFKQHRIVEPIDSLFILLSEAYIDKISIP